MRTNRTSGVFAIGLSAFTYTVLKNGGLIGTYNSAYQSNSTQSYYYGNVNFPNHTLATNLPYSTVNSSDNLSTMRVSVAYVMANGTKDVIGGDAEYSEDGLILPAPESSNVLDVPGALRCRLRSLAQLQQLNTWRLQRTQSQPDRVAWNTKIATETFKPARLKVPARLV